MIFFVHKQFDCNYYACGSLQLQSFFMYHRWSARLIKIFSLLFTISCVCILCLIALKIGMYMKNYSSSILIELKKISHCCSHRFNYIYFNVIFTGNPIKTFLIPPIFENIIIHVKNLYITPAIHISELQIIVWYVMKFVWCVLYYFCFCLFLFYVVAICGRISQTMIIST